MKLRLTVVGCLALLGGTPFVMSTVAASLPASYRGTLLIEKLADGHISYARADLRTGRCPARFIPGTPDSLESVVSHDGTFIAMLRRPEPNRPTGSAVLAVLDVRNGSMHRIASGVTHVGGWFGRRLLYWRGYEEGTLASLDEQGHVVATSVWPTRALLGPALSPDGRLVSYVVSSGDGRAGTFRFTVWTRRLGGGALRRVYQGPIGTGSSIPSATWSPDSRLLLIADISLLFRVRPDGSELRQLDHPRAYVTDADPRWAPDGRSILFTRRRFQSQGTGADQAFGSAGAELYLMRADGTQTHRLTRTPLPLPPRSADGSQAGIWAPAGRAIAFQRNAAVAVMRTNGTGRRTICGADPKGSVVYRPLAWSG